MTSILFVTTLAMLMAGTFYWAFRNLPAEGWQIIASVPVKKDLNGDWQGVNLTYYGFFNATAVTLACAFVFFLMASIRVAITATVPVMASGLIVALLAAKIVAKIVEGKKHTFTVGGAAFALIVVLPGLITLINYSAGQQHGILIPAGPLLAAVSAAYALGEAVGRLACISFGCCYGRSLLWMPAKVRERLRRFCFIFSGTTKKVAYEGKLNGTPVLPIQAMTSVVFTLAGLSGTWLFLRSHWAAAMIVPLATTQIWRVLSEFLRADFRGPRRISAYQVMAVLGLLYGVVVFQLLNQATVKPPNLFDAVHIFANGWLIIVLQSVWLTIFIYLGRSSVTGSRLSFHVIHERV